LANLLAHELDKDFGGYHVLGVLGDGSMGRLYVAEKRGERRSAKGAVSVVALKSFHPERAHAQSSVSEAARWLAPLAHPNIVVVSELGELDGRAFLAMEYLAGENLGAILAGATSTSPAESSAPASAPTLAGPVPPDIGAALVQQSLEALSHVHELRLTQENPPRVIRPDLRPSNIFVTYRGVVKILGCAESILFGSAIDTRVNGRGGLAYTAPELLVPRPALGVDEARAAVFSAGVILWECLTGKQLFAADSPERTMDAIRARYIEPPSVFRPEAPSGLDEVVLRATSRDPKRRYQGAREMSQALDKALLNRRASPESIATWLEGRFGVGRAAIKNQIAEGIAVEAAVVRLRLLGDGALPVHLAPAPSAAEASVSPSAVRVVPAAPHLSAPPAVPATSGRNLRTIYALGGVVVAVVVGALLFNQERAGPTPTAVSATSGLGALQIQSNPAGAQILIDGDPSGLVTPARIDGLRAGRKVEVRVDKPGYRAAAQVANIPLGGPQVLSFALEESLGQVRFEGVPPSATTYIDDAPVDIKHPLSLSVGAHRLRVEVSGRLAGAMKFIVQAGEHTVRVNTEGSEKGSEK